MRDVSIVILTYNQWDLTKQTLESVQDAMADGRISIQTIVSDNASSEDIVGRVKSEFPWVEIVANSSNLGFSAGNNRGVVAADGKYVLFLNSDTKLFKNVLPFLVEQMEADQTIGIASCRVELQNGSLDPACHRGFPTPWRALCYYSRMERVVMNLEKLLGEHSLVAFMKRCFGGYHLLEKDLGRAHQIEACTGAFLLMRRSLGEELGWWDEQFFMYGEDLDLCYRVKEKGLKVMFYPEVKIIHYKHASGLKVSTVANATMSEEQRVARKETKRKTTSAFYEAMKLFYRKHYHTIYPLYLQRLVFIGIDFLKQRALKNIS